MEGKNNIDWLIDGQRNAQQAETRFDVYREYDDNGRWIGWISTIELDGFGYQPTDLRHEKSGATLYASPDGASPTWVK